MIHPLHDLPPGPRPPDELNVVVEIPRGSRNKYELDKSTGMIAFDRLLYSAVHYPGDYGFIPRTLAGDGDPLDALVIVTEPTFPGCLLVARPVGVFVMEDEKGVDEKILAVPVKDPLHHEYRVLHDVPPHFLKEVEHFFAIYKDLEGKTTRVRGWRDLEEARRIVGEAVERYGPVEE
ncbi:MAG TPA: inorganic diphosphatase [Longimicrobiales bacterium]|nr:inorganic diphosphatase [Longimicrobiales bacterium]